MIKKNGEEIFMTGNQLVKTPYWDTYITRIVPDQIVVSGHLITEIIREKTFLETVFLLIKGRFPERVQLRAMEKSIFAAMKLPAPEMKTEKDEELSRKVSKFLLLDEPLKRYAASGNKSPLDKTIFCLARILRCLASVFGNESVMESLPAGHSFSHVLYQVFTGQALRTIKDRPGSLKP